MADGLPRPWHGASDRVGDASVQALRLQRAEVEAMLAFRRAEENSEEAVLLWRRLLALREQRRALLTLDEAAGLSPLPSPPRGALTHWQYLRRRFGLLRMDALVPAARKNSASRQGKEPGR